MPRFYSRTRLWRTTGGDVCEQQRTAEGGDYAIIDFLQNEVQADAPSLRKFLRAQIKELLATPAFNDALRVSCSPILQARQWHDHSKIGCNRVLLTEGAEQQSL